MFAASGRIFGRFQRYLNGYPAHTLHETIPRFHNTEDRLRKLNEAAAADKLGRAAQCRREIDFMLECGMRFLTDHLDGDTYFHISREGQNLDRCRTQCKLVSDMERHWDELRKMVNRRP